jgi:hypothetical protein
MSLVIATFLATFVIVCAVGLFLVARSEGRSTPPFRPPKTAEERQQQAALEQKMLHTIAWLRRLRRAPPVEFAVPLRGDAAPRFGEKVLLGCVLGGIAIGVAWAMIAGGLLVLDWIDEPILDPIFSLVFQISLLPGGGAALGVALLLGGLPFAKRFRRPERFRAGMVLLALSFATFWPLQGLAASVDVPETYWVLQAFLHVFAFFVSGCLFSGGFECIRRALNTPDNDSWEFMR